MDTLKKLSLVIGLVLIVGLVGCGVNNQDATTDQESLSGSTELEVTAQEETMAASETKEFKEDVGNIQSLIKTGKVRECDKINDANIKSACVFQVISNLAQEKDDASICNQLEKDDEKQACISAIEF